MKQWLLVGVLLVGGGFLVGAQVPPGVGAAAFSRIGIDARPLAMAGAFVAVETENPIPYYNPASLALAAPVSLGGMYSEPYGEELGITFQSLGAVGRLGPQTESARSIGLGGGLIQLRIEDIPVWDEDDPGGSGFFTATSAVYVASAAIPVSEDWAIGASVKLYQEKILEGRGRGVGLDIGVQGGFSIEGIPVTVGLNAMDVGETTIRWRGTEGEPENYVTWTNKLGATVRLLAGQLLIAGDFDWGVGRPAREQIVHFGAELHPLKPVFLRGGVRSTLKGEVTYAAGLGMALLDSFHIDYAFVPGRAFGSTHVLSLQMSLPFGR